MIRFGVIANFFKVLNSNQTPNQIAFGASLGMIMAMTPLFSLHNLLILCLILFLNVSIRSAIVTLTLFKSIGVLTYLLSHQIGIYLLITRGDLEPFWLQMQNTPFIPFFKLNNTLILGSLIFSILLFIPFFIGSRVFVVKYREKFMDWWIETKIFKILKRSKIVDWVSRVYSWFPR